MNARKLLAGVAVLAVTAASSALLAPAAGAAGLGVDGEAPVGFGGSAYGSQVQIAGPLAHSGRSAYVVLGCTNRAPTAKHNDTVAVDIDGIGHVGAVTTRATTRGTDATQVWTAKTDAAVAGASLLPGLVELGAITSQARAWNDPEGFHADTAFSIASLSVAGVQVEIDPDGNQVIDLPGVGSLTLGESTTRTSGNSSSATIDAVVLRLTGGTVVRLGHAAANVDEAVNEAVFSGGAYGSTVRVAGTITSGKTANQPIPCVGTRGKNRVNDIAGADLGGLGEAGVVTSTVNARQSPLPEAHATNQIDEVTLAGAVELEAITAAVSVYEDADGEITYDTEGTSLGSITIAGVEISVPPAGGQVVLPGIGTLSFSEVGELAGGRGVEVTAVRIVLLDGSVIVLGHAEATIK